jgi:hypothetical protein
MIIIDELQPLFAERFLVLLSKAFLDDIPFNRQGGRIDLIDQGDKTVEWSITNRLGQTRIKFCKLLFPPVGVL